MALRRFGTFTGGINLPDDKQATLASAIVPAKGLERLRVPLAPVDGPPARLLVEPGRRVRRGERLAAAGSDGQVDVAAPLGGRVAGLCRVVLASTRADASQAMPLLWRSSPAVELTDLDPPPPIGPLPVAYEWTAADDHSLRLRIAEGGLTTFRHPAEPLAGWIERARAAGVDTLIANAMENTPLITADHSLLARRGTEVVTGLAILARAIGAEQVMLAVDHRRTEAYREVARPARNYRIQLISLAHKYPIGAEEVLVKVLTRREVPGAGGCFDVAAAVTDAATCWAAYRWTACGEPPVARVVTVAGPAIARPANLLVPFGAAADDVLASAGHQGEDRAILGSAMTGRQLVADVVLGGADDALLGIPVPPPARPTPCIRCGWCIDHCPARLNVAGLNDDFELGRLARAARRGATSCVGCGICSYLCPAKLPLTQRVRQLKHALREAAAAPADRTT